MKKLQVAVTCSFAVVLALSYTEVLRAAPVGKVIFAAGHCFAENHRKERRKLRRASKLNEGDIIYTQHSSKAQLRFVDGAVISLAENTTFKVSEYEYSDTKNKSNLELIKGGLRAITGKITSKEDYEYTVKTPLASFSAEDAYWSATLVPVSGSPRADLSEPFHYQQELPSMFAEATLPPIVEQMPVPTLYGAPGQDNLKTELHTAVWRGEVSGVTNTGQAFNMGPTQNTNFGKIGADNKFIALVEQPDAVAVTTDRKSSERIADNTQRQQQESGPSSRAGTKKPSSSPKLSRQQKALALPPVAVVAGLAPLPAPLIDDINDVSPGSSSLLAQNPLIGATEVGVVLNRNSPGSIFPAGLAKTIDRNTGDAAIGNAFSEQNVTGGVIKGEGTFTALSAGAATGGSFNWDTDPEINLLYGKWTNPTLINSEGISTLNELYVGIVTPMKPQSNSFSGQIFGTLDFYTASTNVTTINNLALDLTYNHLAHQVTVDAFDFDFVINKSGGGTINYTNIGTLSKGPLPGTVFEMQNNNLTCGGCGTFDANLTAAITGEVISPSTISETGVAGILSVRNQDDAANNAQIAFGLSD